MRNVWVLSVWIFCALLSTEAFSESPKQVLDVLFQKKNFLQARSFFEKTWKEAPSLELLLFFGKKALKARNRSLLLSVFKKYAPVFSSRAQKKKILQFWTYAFTLFLEEQHQIRFEKGWRFCEKKSFSKGVSFLKQVHHQESLQVNVLLALGCCLEDAKEFEDAAFFIKKAYKVLPHESLVAVRYAESLLWKKKFRKSQKVLHPFYRKSLKAFWVWVQVKEAQKKQTKRVFWLLKRKVKKNPYAVDLLIELSKNYAQKQTSFALQEAKKWARLARSRFPMFQKAFLKKRHFSDLFIGMSFLNKIKQALSKWEKKLELLEKKQDLKISKKTQLKSS